jgi:hypothetical protein
MRPAMANKAASGFATVLRTAVGQPAAGGSDVAKPTVRFAPNGQPAGFITA